MRALLSVSDKTGLVALGRGLARLGWELIATAGTAAHLEPAGVPVSPAQDYTEFPEMFGGRVRTLDVRVFAGVLYRRNDPADEAAMRAYGLRGIDLVACTFHPFDAVTATPGEDAVATIDIGGPAMVRAAAKNHAAVLAVVDPADYGPVLAALDRTGGSPALVPARVRRRLAAKAFRCTEAYDRAIAAYLERLGG